LIKRLTPVRLALGIALLASGLTRMASAQTGVGGATGTTSLTAADLLIVAQSTPGVALRDFDLQRFFNVANCNCATPVSVFFTFSTSGFAKKPTLPEGTIEFWYGLNCNNVTVRNCTRLGDTVQLTTFAANGGVTITTDVQQLSQNFGQPAVSGSTTLLDGGVVVGDGGATGPGPAACGSGIAFSQTIWALVTFNGDPPYDVSATLAVNIDMAPPPPPDFTLGPGNEGINVNWTGLNTALYPDLLGYQVLCDRAGSLQVFNNGTFGAGFRTCPTVPFPDELDGHILGLDPNYTCSKQTTQTSSSWRVKILQNDIWYGVAVVAIDNSYNASAPFVKYAKPIPTLSFYDVYRNDTNPNGPPEAGRATGGLCAVSGTTSSNAGAAGLTAIALATGLAFGGRRRRRPRP
jgi:hypothetical protein